MQEGSGRRRHLTLRFMCGNALGMLAFVLAFLAVPDFRVAAVAALVVGAIGYAGSSVVVDYVERP